jgi:hypothetical protein
VNVPLRHDDAAVTGQIADREGVSAALSQPGAERVPGRMYHAIPRQAQRVAYGPELLADIAASELASAIDTGPDPLAARLCLLSFQDRGGTGGEWNVAAREFRLALEHLHPATEPGFPHKRSPARPSAPQRVLSRIVSNGSPAYTVISEREIDMSCDKSWWPFGQKKKKINWSFSPEDKVIFAQLPEQIQRHYSGQLYLGDIWLNEEAAVIQFRPGDREDMESQSWYKTPDGWVKLLEL